MAITRWIVAAMLAGALLTGAREVSTPEQTDAGSVAADAVVREWVEAERIPGAVLLVSRDGRVVFEKAYGWAQLYAYDEGQYGASAAGEARPAAIRRLETPVPMRVDTVFDLASVTKVMATTFAVMLLADGGELELDAPVRRYLPDFRDRPPDGQRPSIGGKSEITVRHLLTHRAGLSQWQPIYYSAAGADAAYRFIRDFPLAWAVGAERHYSDLGFMLLGEMVRRVSGRSIGAYVRERLYEPLGLTATGFNPRPPTGGIAGSRESRSTDAAAALPGAAAAAGRFAATSHGNPFEHRMVHDPGFGYRIDGDPDTWDGWRRYTLVGEVNDGNAFHAFAGEAGHAGLFSSARDLQVLLQLLLDRGEHGGRRYLSGDTVDEFLASTGEGQALGWQVPEYLPEGSFHHSGFTGAYVAGVPSAGIAVVLLTNRQNGGVNGDGQYPDVGELQRAVAGAVTGYR